MKSDFNAKHYLTGQVLEGIDTTDLLICEVRPYISSFGNFAVLYISLNRVCMTFARLSTLRNSLAFSLESLNPRTL